MVADAALGRAAGHVVLDAIALEDGHRAVVHERRDRDQELPLRIAQHLAHAVVEAQLLGRGVELALGDVEGVQVLLGHALDVLLAIHGTLPRETETLRKL